MWSIFWEIDKISVSELGFGLGYFLYRIIPYSTRHRITKKRQKISHNPIEETEFALAVGELVLTDMKMLTKFNINPTSIPILPGFSGRIVKLAWRYSQT